MEEKKYSDDERWAINTWLFRRKPFPTHLSRDDALYDDIVKSLHDMGHERSASGIRHMLERQFGSELTQERVVEKLRVLYERQPDNWFEPLDGMTMPRVRGYRKVLCVCVYSVCRCFSFRCRRDFCQESRATTEAAC